MIAGMIALCNNRMSLPQFSLFVFMPPAIPLEMASPIDAIQPHCVCSPKEPMVTLTGESYGLPLFLL